MKEEPQISEEFYIHAKEQACSECEKEARNLAILSAALGVGLGVAAFAMFVRIKNG